jgi:hypothetical protein
MAEQVQVNDETRIMNLFNQEVERIEKAQNAIVGENTPVINDISKFYDEKYDDGIEKSEDIDEDDSNKEITENVTEKQPDIKGEDNKELSQIGDNSIPDTIVEYIHTRFGLEYSKDKHKWSSIEDIANFIDNYTALEKEGVFANEEIRNLNEYVEAGGSIEEFFNTIFGNSSIDGLEDKEVIIQYFKEQGWKEEKINKKINDFEIDGTLQREANDIREVWKELENENNSKFLENELAKKKEYDNEIRKMREEYEKYLLTQNDISGNKLTRDSVEKIKEVLYLPVDKDGRRQIDYIFGDPDKLAIIAQLENINWDFSKIALLNKSELTKQFADSLRKQGIGMQKREINNLNTDEIADIGTLYDRAREESDRMLRIQTEKNKLNRK